MRTVAFGLSIVLTCSVAACDGGSAKSSSTQDTEGGGGSDAAAGSGATNAGSGAGGKSGSGTAGKGGSGTAGTGTAGTGAAGTTGGGGGSSGGSGAGGAAAGASGKGGGGAAGSGGNAGSGGSGTSGSAGSGGSSGGSGGSAGASTGGSAGAGGSAGTGTGGSSGTGGSAGMVSGTPTTIAMNEFSINAMTLDKDTVYWVTAAISGGSVKKLPKTVSAPIVTLATAQGDLTGIANDGTNVYYTSQATPIDGGKVLSVPMAGGSPTPIAASQYKPQKIAHSGGSIFWTNAGGGNAGKAQVWSWKVGAGNTVPLFTGIATDSPYGVTVDGSSVYFSVAGLSHTVQSVAVAGGNASIVTTLPTSPSIPTPGDVLVVGTRAYVMDIGGGGIPAGLWAADLPSGMPKQVGVATSTGGSVAGDAKGIYWSDPNGGKVWTLAPGDSTSTVFWSTPGDFPVALAVDDTYVFCATVGGNLVRIAR